MVLWPFAYYMPNSTWAFGPLIWDPRDLPTTCPSFPKMSFSLQPFWWLLTQQHDSQHRVLETLPLHPEFHRTESQLHGGLFPVWWWYNLLNSRFQAVLYGRVVNQSLNVSSDIFTPEGLGYWAIVHQLRAIFCLSRWVGVLSFPLHLSGLQAIYFWWAEHPLPLDPVLTLMLHLLDTSWSSYKAPQSRAISMGEG